MSCVYCGAEKIYAKGFCSLCYQRNLRTGSPEVTRKFIKPGSCCTTEGCENTQVAGGLCDKHYRMNNKRGCPVSDFGYGERRKHPFYEVWRQMARAAQRRVPEWDDFWRFVADCGGRPTAVKTTAKRFDDEQPWGPSNFKWAEVLASSTDTKEYQRKWRAKNPLKAKNSLLRSNYGITLEQYHVMYTSQCGKCAICGTAGEAFDTANGKVSTLAVDHDHATGAIRNLLCSHCNTALGGFKDSPELLETAASYLRRHRCSQLTNNV